MSSINNVRDINAELLIREGQRYEERLAFAKALDAYWQAAKLEPEHAPIHFNIGFVLSKLGRWSEAANSYREAIRLRPSDTQAYINLGFVYYELGLDEEAQQCFNRARDLGGLANGAEKMQF